jgi:hypothetical protein
MATAVHHSTALTEAEWMEHLNNRHGTYVLAEGQSIIEEGPCLKVWGAFVIASHDGRSVRFESRTDFILALTAAALLES